MSKIHILSDDISNRIAAGEVIERPASVVKELVENSIDAGASHIRIEIERAGSRLIEVSDDGSGMDADDALLCIEPHGTSKIKDASDIEKIMTLGFRGEAIPSIASISKFTLVTRRVSDREAVKVTVEGGKLRSADPAGAGPGTTIRVAELFYNTPARRKFLKSPATESHHIEECVIAMAIPNWKVSFELILDGRRAFLSPGAEDPTSRLRDFFGRNYVDNLWPVDYAEGNYHVSGFIGAPGFTRNSRKEQRTFVNFRSIESLALYRGIREGYATLAEPGRFPPCVLFFELPPTEVDVNVHPAKREVRFKQEYAVGRAVSCAVTRALRRTREEPSPALASAAEVSSPFAGLTADGHVPLKLVLSGAEIEYHPSPVEQPELIVENIPEENSPCADSDSSLKFPENSEKSKVAENPAGLDLTDRPVVPEKPDENIRDAEDSFELPEEPFIPDPRSFSGRWPTDVLGIFDDTYLLCSGPDGLVLVDQHAAHERIMFERLLDKLKRKSTVQQQLLIPETVELPLSQAGLLLRNAKVFSPLGFDVEPMGKNTVMVNSIPADLNSRRGIGAMFSDMLAELVENAVNRIPAELLYVARAACRAAVKAHDKLSLPEARNLLEELRRCRQGTLCPHGRPTMITLSRNELEKRFGRR